jgi:hypothetical protein
MKVNKAVEYTFYIFIELLSKLNLCTDATFYKKFALFLSANFQNRKVWYLSQLALQDFLMSSIV